jgi:CheY-like chemotaxis protein
MNLQSLVVCSDDRTLRVLRAVLGELEIEVEHCAESANATKELAKHAFEAVIIDCKNQADFSLLQSVRSGQHNRKSMAVAIIDAQTDLHTAFARGANFVVYKPVSSEKAKSSFRAARALMKRERRRSTRLQVDIPAYFRFENGEGEQATISGLGEGGVSVRFASPEKRRGVIGFSFVLPETTTMIQVTGVIAWQDSRRRAGIQFSTRSDASRRNLQEWLREKCEDVHDPPSSCTLTALSLGGCFLRTDSPFPTQTRVELLLRAADRSVRTEGKVRFMHPELGMGIQFMSRTPDHRRRLEELIQQIIVSPDTVAEVLVEPEGLDWEGAAEGSDPTTLREAHPEAQTDPLLDLLGRGATLSREQFLRALEQHELAPAPASEADLNSTYTQRREPRIEVSRAVQIWVQDSSPASVRHTASMTDVSHHGARIDHATLSLKPGDTVHLLSSGQDARFRVIWVGEPGTPEEGQVGLQKTHE